MKPLVAGLVLLALLVCCSCTPVREKRQSEDGVDGGDYDNDNNNQGETMLGREDYEVYDDTKHSGGRWGWGLNLGGGLGVGKKGLQGNFGINTGGSWDTYSGNRKKHYTRTRPIYPIFNNMGNPGMGNYGMGNPGMGNYGMGNPGMGNYGMGNPGMGNYGMGNSGMGNYGYGGPYGY